MTFSELRKALETLEPFYKDPLGYHIGAEHDIIYFFATDLPLSQEAIAAARGEK